MHDTHYIYRYMCQVILVNALCIQEAQLPQRMESAISCKSVKQATISTRDGRRDGWTVDISIIGIIGN